MGVGWGVLSWATIRADKVEGGKGSTCAFFKGIKKVLGWGSTFTHRIKGRWGKLVGGV
jgi:hypothetical protein